VLKLSQPAFDQLRRHGEQTYPCECCGVLLGRIQDDEHRVSEVVPCGNTRDDRPQDRFNISPSDLVRIQRQGRERGLDIIGFYHSHPDHPPRWSQTDLAEAHWIGCSYVITSVESGRAIRTESFVLLGAGEDDKRFQDEPIEVVEEQVSLREFEPE